MNFATFYYLAVLIVFAAKLFGYLAISWLWIAALALAPLLIGVVALFVIVIMAAFSSSGKVKINKRW